MNEPLGLSPDDIAERCDGARRVSDGWRAKCPAHGGDNPESLHIFERDGRPFVKCFAHNCSRESIFESLGITKYGAPPMPNNETVYDYHDVAGNVVSRVTRYYRDGKKVFAQSRPDPANSGKFINGLDGLTPPIFQLPKVIKAIKAGEIVLILEGEKDCITASRLGYTGTTNAMGAGKWKSAHSEYLKGAHAVIVPDNDELGAEHAAAVVEALQGVAASVKLVNLPGLPEKGDLTDWVEAGGTREQLGKLIDSVNIVHSVHSMSWEPPMPLGDFEVPQFPTYALPDVLRDFVEALAEATQTPLDLSATLTLAACAAALARKVDVCVSQGYTEPVNLFVAIALPPGSRKSAVFEAVTRPIQDFEATETERLAPQVAEASSALRVAEQALKHAEALAAKSSDALERKHLTLEAQKMAQEVDALPRMHPPRFIADDTTAERLAVLMSEQGGRMAVLSAEGGDLFDILGGRYTGGAPNFGVFLKGHAGDMLRVDRVGRPSVFVEKPALTLGITVQPEALNGLISKPGFRGRGLLGRFLYAIPHNMLGARDTNPPPVPSHVRERYHQRLTKLMRTPYGTDQAGQEAAHTLTLSSEAKAIIDSFARWLEPQLAPFGTLGHMTDWAGKLGGAAARVAGILHIAEHADEDTPWTLPVSEATMRHAVAISTYAIPHAKAAYGAMDADPALGDARYFADWIQRTGCEWFVKREAHRATRGRFKKAADLNGPLALLVEHGYIRLRPEEKRQGAGRAPSPIYDVNPLLNALDTLDRMDRIHEFNPSEPYSVHSVHSVHSLQKSAELSDERERGVI